MMILFLDSCSWIKITFSVPWGQGGAVCIACECSSAYGRAHTHTPHTQCHGTTDCLAGVSRAGVSSAICAKICIERMAHPDYKVAAWVQRALPQLRQLALVAARQHAAVAAQHQRDAPDAHAVLVQDLPGSRGRRSAGGSKGAEVHSVCVRQTSWRVAQSGMARPVWRSGRGLALLGAQRHSLAARELDVHADGRGVGDVTQPALLRRHL